MKQKKDPVYRRKDGKWGWRLRAANNRIIAGDQGQGYENEADCREMFRRVVSGEFAITEDQGSEPS